MSLSRSGWLLTALSAALVGLTAPQADTLVDDVGGSSFPDALLALGSLVMLALAAWSLLAAVLIVLGGSTRLVAALTPVAMRRALLAGAAGAMVVAPAAHAGQLVAPEPAQHSVHGLPLPDRPDVVRASTSRPAQAPSTSDVEVRPGDTLWGIAAHHLPAGSTTTQIAAATAAWHDTNRDVIGRDPDVIVPGQILAPPNAEDPS